MNKAAGFLLGAHNFRSFSSFMAGEKKYEREIIKIKVENSGDFFDVGKSDLVKLTIEANSFLYNMVRIITGTMIDVGLGKIAPQEVKNILKAKDRKKAGKTAAPQGLFLVKVKY